MKKILNLLLCLGLCGCASMALYPMDKDTYMITRSAAQLYFGQPVVGKGVVYKEANEFCAKQNKEVETIDCEMVSQIFGRPGRVSLKFRCVNKVDRVAPSTKQE